MSSFNRLKITTEGTGQWAVHSTANEVLGFLMKTDKGYEHTLSDKPFNAWWECYEQFCYVAHFSAGGPPPALPQGYDPTVIPEGWTFEGQVRPPKKGEHYFRNGEVQVAQRDHDTDEWVFPIIVKVEEAAPRAAPDLNAFEQAVLKLVYSEPNTGITAEGIYNSTISFDRDHHWVRGAIELLMGQRLIRAEPRRLDGRKTEFYFPAEPRPELLDWLPQYGIEAGAEIEQAIEYQRDPLMVLDVEEQEALTETAIDELKRAYPYVLYLQGERAADPNTRSVEPVDGVMFFDSQEGMAKVLHRLGMAPPAPVPVHPDVLRDGIERWLNENGMADDLRFYTQAEWIGHGTFEDASLHMTVQGALYRLISYGLNKTEQPDLEQDFYKLVERHGYEMKLAYDWSAHFYPVGTKHADRPGRLPKPKGSKLLAIVAAILF